MNAMRVAIPVWNGRVSPVFDTAGQLLVVDWEKDRSAARFKTALSPSSIHQRAGILAKLGIDMLVCGAISRPLAELITAHGIGLIPWIAGDVEEVLDAQREGVLPDPRYLMPGCHRQRHRCGHRGRRGRPRGGY